MRLGTWRRIALVAAAAATTAMGGSGGEGSSWWWWLCPVAEAAATTSSSSSSSSKPAPRNQTLLPWVFSPLPVGAIRPAGWLRGEMQAMADGLAGHELDILDYVYNSPWLNANGRGTEYSALNEALPYWFNGMVPLAYALGDERLMAQAEKVVLTVMGLQSADGWIGPEARDRRNLWGRPPFFLGMMQMAEANATAAPTLVASLRRFLRLANGMLRDNGNGFTRCPGLSPIDCTWGQVRAHDLILVIQWLLEHHPSSSTTTGSATATATADDDDLLWDTMEMLYDQSNFKWDRWYRPGVYQQVVEDPTPGNRYFPYLHGVNVGQGLKASAVIRRFTHDDGLLKSAHDGANWTFTYHGAPSGTILADEIQRDLAPYSGSELCTAVETAYSLAYLYQSLGVNEYADRAELVAFNALPVMMTEDQWAHQYMDQPNGPWAVNHIEHGSVYTTAHGASTVFGLEPQYPCCTVNFPQGYPKFLVNSWGRTDTGLVHALLSPSTVTTTLRGGGRVRIECRTNYPFDGTLTYWISASAPFDLHLRVPSWAIRAQTNVALHSPTTGRAQTVVAPDSATGLHRVSIPAGQSTVVYSVGLSLRTESRRGGAAVSVYVGAVLYALDLEPSVVSVLPRRYYDANGGGTTEFLPDFPQVREYYFNATRPWNVAIDPATLRAARPASAADAAELPRAFGASGAPNFLTVRGCLVDWDLKRDITPDFPPDRPRCRGKPTTFKMVPYGGAKVHMSELPTVDLSIEPVEGQKPMGWD